MLTDIFEGIRVNNHTLYTPKYTEFGGSYLRISYIPKKLTIPPFEGVKIGGICYSSAPDNEYRTIDVTNLIKTTRRLACLGDYALLKDDEITLTDDWNFINRWLDYYLPFKFGLLYPC
jgi:hypothetical protein